MPSIELKLLSVECVKSSEKETDELFVELESELFGDRDEKVTRFPSGDAKHWSLKSGEKKELNLTLFNGSYEGSAKFEVEFKEDDSLGLGAIPVFGRFLNKGIEEIQDNEFGGLHVVADANGRLTWKSGDDTLGEEGADGTTRTFTLRGAGAHYKAVLSAVVHSN
jgi:hypothetical protein